MSSKDKVVVCSCFLNVIDLENGGWLLTNAALGGRVYADQAILSVVRSFEQPRSVAEFCADEAEVLGFPEHALRSFIEGLVKDGLLFDTAQGDERARVARTLRAHVGQPPNARQNRGFELGVTRTLESQMKATQKCAMLFFGACSVQVVVDVLRGHALERGIAIDGWATSFEELDAIERRQPEMIVVGHLRYKNDIFDFPEAKGGALPIEGYTNALDRFLSRVRERTRAPVLVLNVPAPTTSPLGVAGAGGPQDTARRLNLAIAETVARHEGASVVDLDSALSLYGKRWLLDDALSTFGHLGSMSWLAHRFARPTPGLEAYSIDPALIPEPLQQELEHELVVAETLLHHLLVHFGPKKKCVVVDLDGTLWPGVLADNGTPWPGAPMFDNYPYAVFLGLHSALKALMARGVLLACVSKNDKSVVEALFESAPSPSRFFLKLDDFVSCRINWREKVDNIKDIAAELNIGTDSLVFIDDHPVEREKVSRTMPEVWVLGDSPYETRWQLLSSPALQTPTLTLEASRRGEMVHAQLQREKVRESALDEAAFMRELSVVCRFGPLPNDSKELLARAYELAQRTNQLNTTTERWTREALEQGARKVYLLQVEDRFSDYGTVGVAVTSAGVLESLLVSCRVLGLGVARVFFELVLERLLKTQAKVRVPFRATERNGPARSLLMKYGLSEQAGDTELVVSREAERFKIPDYYRVIPLKPV